MDYETYGFNEGLPDIEALAILMVDASGTMGQIAHGGWYAEHPREAKR
jgi:hypothetical protein